MLLRCYYHQLYDGIKRPKDHCLDCWELFLGSNPKENIKSLDALKIVKGLRDQLTNKMSNDLKQLEEHLVNMIRNN